MHIDLAIYSKDLDGWVFVICITNTFNVNMQEHDATDIDEPVLSALCDGGSKIILLFIHAITHIKLSNCSRTSPIFGSILKFYCFFFILFCIFTSLLIFARPSMILTTFIKFPLLDQKLQWFCPGFCFRYIDRGVLKWGQ